MDRLQKETGKRNRELILDVLRDYESHTVCEVAAASGLSRPTVYKHVRQLASSLLDRVTWEGHSIRLKEHWLMSKAMIRGELRALESLPFEGLRIQIRSERSPDYLVEVDKDGHLHHIMRLKDGWTLRDACMARA